MHEIERVDAHVAQVGEALLALVEIGEDANLLADLAVRRQIARAAVDAELASGLPLGGEILGLFAGIHHLSRATRDQTTQT